MSRQSSSVMQKEFDKAKLDDGPRRITNYNTKLTIDPLAYQNVSTGSITHDYEGPVYYYGSNREGGWRSTFKVLYLQELKTDEVNNRYY